VGRNLVVVRRLVVVAVSLLYDVTAIGRECVSFTLNAPLTADAVDVT
jgi:hypothetical protein